MPKEKKIRGRRNKDKKRKLDADADAEADEISTKRRRQSNDDPQLDQAVAQETTHHGEDGAHAVAGAHPHPGETPFYGLLDDEEQEYFRSADEMLELNQFSSPDDRDNFLNSVYKEAEGKELKMANSQSCSRLMERLIQLSSPAQLKSLFQKFAGHFLHLVQHRFASHCCEALFTAAAPVVTVEMKHPPRHNTETEDETPQSMEASFLSTLQELDSYLGYLLTDKFASHTLRVLLAVLSGQPLARTEKGSRLNSKNKEHVSVVHNGAAPQATSERRVVPASFTVALDKFVSQSVAGFDTAFLQSLSLHPTGNPTLQLLLQLELTVFGKAKAKDENSIIHKLLPDDPITDDTDSGKFINSSIYDQLGSRLLETIINYAPGKLFKSLYKTFFKERVAQLARNDIASYIVGTILQRLSKDDLKDATNALVAQMPLLVERNRTVLIRVLIERCTVRDVDHAPIASALSQAYGGPNGFDITQLLKVQNVTTENVVVANKDSATKSQLASEKLHGSLLAQTMAATPGPLGKLIIDSFPRLGTPLLIQIAKDQNASRALQAAITTPIASVVERRKIIQCFYGHVAELSLDPSASHVIDAVWTGTHGLAFIRERIAEELAENEAAMRESHVGRAVWRNWKMDMYKRRRKDWVIESRASAGSDSFMPFPEEDENITGDENEQGKAKSKRPADKHLTAIEKARLKHATKRQDAEKKAKHEEKEAASGTNNVAVMSKGKRVRNDENGENEAAVEVVQAGTVEENHMHPDRRKKRKSMVAA